jgi:hypothetical protein
VIPTLLAPGLAHRAGIICDDLVRLLVLALAGMKTIKGNQIGYGAGNVSTIASRTPQSIACAENFLCWRTISKRYG